MTREERENVINFLKGYLDEEVYTEKCRNAHKMAIKALEQEPCCNCIEFKRYAKEMGFEIEQEPCDKYIKEIDHLRKYISKLETRIVEQEQRWIPVNEGLPKEYRFVNCTCHSLIDDREDWVVETVYIPQPSNSPYSDWGNIPMLNCGDCEVIAWMYRDIPKPYRAESEEK